MVRYGYRRKRAGETAGRNEMDNRTIETLFPQFLEISDESLRTVSEDAMLAAMKKGGWDEENIRLCPVTLNWKNCDVTWIEHVRDVTDMCRMEFDHLKKYYERHGVPFSRDIVVAGALLHDIGKLTEFVCRDRKAVHGDDYQLMRHPLSGALIADRCGVPTELVHLIAVHSFEGDKSYQTPESEFVRTVDIFTFQQSVKGLEKIG